MKTITDQYLDVSRVITGLEMSQFILRTEQKEWLGRIHLTIAYCPKIFSVDKYGKTSDV